MHTLPKAKPIIVVGAGAFGLSTALHLSRSGYSNITVLDKGASIPSGFSAANDVNKILRAEYEDPFYTNLTIVNAAQRLMRMLWEGIVKAFASC